MPENTDLSPNRPVHCDSSGFGCGSSYSACWSSLHSPAHRHTTRGVPIDNSLAATNREITNVATALAEQTAWTFQGIDLLLRDTARWYQNDSKKIAPERLDEVLANRSAGVRQIRLITITDAQGIQRHRSRGSSPPHLDVSDRSYFIAQRDGTAAGLFMSEPLITRSDGRPGIILSRRLEDETGAFAGVVAAIVNLEDLEKFYAAVTLGNGSAVQLLRDDGQLLMRDPPDPACHRSRNFRNSPHRERRPAG